MKFLLDTHIWIWGLDGKLIICGNGSGFVSSRASLDSSMRGRSKSTLAND
jgi:PIN domain nuclease of toxin-antitoxin system